ncbi:MAG: hypothetical protein JRI34_00805 [Deltaproteobacteria bacterium]|nr:hypothetical protein [Deltaproteobacteria bacterium]
MKNERTVERRKKVYGKEYHWFVWEDIPFELIEYGDYFRLLEPNGKIVYEGVALSCAVPVKGTLSNYEVRVVDWDKLPEPKHEIPSV